MRKTIAILSVLICAICAEASIRHTKTADKLSPTSLTFASQSAGTTSAAQAVTLANTGTTTIAISSINVSGNFAQTNTCGSSLASGASCAISVTFTPASTGTLTGTLSITDSDSSSAQTVSLTGTGITTSATLSATNLAFGNETVNTTSSSQTVTLTNTGTTTITVSSINVSSNFSESDNCSGTSLAAGAQCSIVVLFDPATVGAISGSATIADSVSSSPQTLALSGTGIAATSSVALTWTENSSGVVGYNVYRSTISGGSYSLLNSSPVTSSSYTDNTVVTGSTYYYVATAVNSSGEQSSYSNQATAVIP